MIKCHSLVIRDNLSLNLRLMHSVHVSSNEWCGLFSGHYHFENIWMILLHIHIGVHVGVDIVIVIIVVVVIVIVDDDVEIDR